MAQLAGLAKPSSLKQRLRHSSEEDEGVELAIHPRFRRCRKRSPVEISITVRQDLVPKLIGAEAGSGVELDCTLDD